MAFSGGSIITQWLVTGNLGTECWVQITIPPLGSSVASGITTVSVSQGIALRSELIYVKCFEQCLMQGRSSVDVSCCL